MQGDIRTYARRYKDAYKDTRVAPLFVLCCLFCGSCMSCMSWSCLLASCAPPSPSPSLSPLLLLLPSPVAALKYLWIKPVHSKRAPANALLQKTLSPSTAV